ncbi:alanyl-tRNA synthetase [Sinobacterium caligoides]|uniref:Alanine--tRNA ligase n=1 Tax=Sinobacterium caligoides TaxID=933926 RepID=A0A3N2DNH5_9GAMM|nr:alanine--tRNA ligase [Sinobacterium caligoides]ROS01358.1 alanyl-tRNA synthetase [Sinobacterium caligoides]
MKSTEIREAFLKFYESKGHQRVASSSLVPGNDPTLLFTNAGMVQFKDVFLGQESRPYKTATSSQRCVRAGGKHNDLENVGYTARHHTFFEMLGNFSFGDYFKREAIKYAWEFLTEVLQLPEEKLWVTVHISDQEAEDIWLKEMGVSAERFSRLDEDNFWQMGDTGPCGPSSEIFYDHGEDVFGGPPGSPNDDGDRYIEIWNLVFMQYERSASGQAELPNPSIDTGMGLERIAAIMQGVHTNYEIDMFQALLQAVAKETGATDMEDKSLRVVADHIRSCAFLIVDGILPGNEGRAYVLRRIMRRAIRHGNKLGASSAFFYKLVATLVKEMGDAYPELVEQQAQIEKIILAEEQQFAKTLENGMAILNAAIDDLQDNVLPGDVVFKLYDTYGFPVDLTNDIARERELVLDMEGYELAMQAQRQRSKGAGSFELDYNQSFKMEGSTEFTGHTDSTAEAKVVALLVEGERVDSVVAGSKAVIVLDRTPFYAEAGGQVGDCGYISSDAARFEATDTTKAGGHHLHHGVVLEGSLSLGDTVTASINSAVRKAIAVNHSATHLLHAALRKVVGEQVAQKGSLVTSERLRFDFSNFEAVTPAQLRAVEEMVNAQVRANVAVSVELTDMESAKQKGAMALFGEKYGDVVRLLSMGEENFSVELCGGTHVERTGDIGLIRIVSESGIASGVRRLEAVTGAQAMALFEQTDAELMTIAATVKGNRDNVVTKVEGLVQTNRQLEKQIQQLQAKLASAAGSDLASEAFEVAGIKILIAKLEGVEAKALRDTIDQLKNKLGKAAIVLAGVNDGKVALAAGVTKAEAKSIKAGDMLRQLATAIGGKGGGKPEMAQGGGGDSAALPAAIDELKVWAQQQLEQ